MQKIKGTNSETSPPNTSKIKHPITTQLELVKTSFMRIIK